MLPLPDTSQKPRLQILRAWGVVSIDLCVVSVARTPKQVIEMVREKETAIIILQPECVDSGHDSGAKSQLFLLQPDDSAIIIASHRIS